MKKVISFLAIAVFFITGAQTLLAQEVKSPNKLFYAEFGGPGIIMSANLDSRFKPSTRVGFGFRIGAGFGMKNFNDGENREEVLRTVYAFPAGINYIFGKPNVASSFEVGAGASFLSRKTSYYDYGVKEEGNMIGFLTFMYRVTPVNGGMSFRIGFTPIIGTAGDLYPMGAIGFGYAF